MTIHIPSDNTNPLKNPLESHSASTVPAKSKLIEAKHAIPVPVQVPASETSMQKHSLDNLTQFSTPQIVSTLKKDKVEVEKLVLAATSLKQHPEILTKQVIDKITADVISKIVSEGKAGGGTPLEAPVAVNKKEIDLSHAMQPFQIEESFIKELPQLELAVVGTNLLSRGAVIFTSGMLLNKIEEAIEAKEQYLASVQNEPERKAIQEEITILKKWVNVRLAIMSSSMKDLALNAVMSSPKAFSAIVVLAKATGTVVSHVIDWAGLGIGLIGSALSFHASRMNFKAHDAWTALVGTKGEGESVDDLEKRKVNVDKIIERQKKIFAARFESNHPELAKRIKEAAFDLDITAFSNENWTPEAETLAKLKEAGIDLSEIREAVNDLKKKEMLSVSLRKGLLAFNQKKDSIDKGFLQQDVNKSGGLLTLASVLTGGIIVLKSLLLASVIASTVALSVVGYGMLVGVIGGMIFGAVYLYIKKPNIFKTYLKGVQILLAFWNIPRAVQNFRSHYAQLSEMRVSDQINDIRGRVLEAEGLLKGEGKDKDIESFLNKHLPEKKTSGLNVDDILKKYVKKLKKTEAAKLKEAEHLKQKIAGLNESIDYFEAKIKPLQAEVNAAGWKDFQRSLDRKQEVEAVDDDASILAEYLVKDIGLQEDSETRKLLLHMDINPNTLSKEDTEDLKVMVAERIRAFFAMETSETMSLISKQNLLVKHGLRENIADS